MASDEENMALRSDEEVSLQTNLNIVSLLKSILFQSFDPVSIGFRKRNHINFEKSANIDNFVNDSR